MDITITDSQWQSIEPYFMLLRNSTQGRSVNCMRQVASAIIWVCANGKAWMDIPRSHAPFSTCNAKYRQLKEAKLWDKILFALALDLKEKARIDITYCFVKQRYSLELSAEIIANHINYTNACWVNQTLRVFLNPYADVRFRKEALKLKRKIKRNVKMAFAQAS